MHKPNSLMIVNTFKWWVCDCVFGLFQESKEEVSTHDLLSPNAPAQSRCLLRLRPQRGPDRQMCHRQQNQQYTNVSVLHMLAWGDWKQNALHLIPLKWVLQEKRNYEGFASGSRGSCLCDGCELLLQRFSLWFSLRSCADQIRSFQNTSKTSRWMISRSATS